jgi:CheY-like chemotaxis protein
LATARESLERLTRLVENLLDMSRLQAGALSVLNASTRLDDVVPLALDALGPQGERVVVDIPESLPEVIADPALLERVIANVTANAIRFSPAESPPLLAASSHSEWVQLRMIDRGPGIAELDRERMFTPFQRLGDTDNTTGTGLGLALSRGLMEAMGGELIPEETPGGGLTMVIQLRMARQPGQRDLMTTVLVVDDEPQILRALRVNLAAREYDVVTASSGRQALDAAAHHHPDLVVLDLGLPDMDGVEVVRGLRGWTTVPIIILSGRSQSAAKVQALDAGADDYVTKPFNVD